MEEEPARLSPPAPTKSRDADDDGHRLERTDTVALVAQLAAKGCTAYFLSPDCQRNAACS
jgi:hypothetical protein